MNKKYLYGFFSCIFAFNLLTACNGEMPGDGSEDDVENGTEENMGGDDLDEDVEDEGIEDTEQNEDTHEDVEEDIIDRDKGPEEGG